METGALSRADACFRIGFLTVRGTYICSGATDTAAYTNYATASTGSNSATDYDPSANYDRATNRDCATNFDCHTGSCASGINAQNHGRLHSYTIH